MSELNKFNRESLSVTSAMPTFTGGAKKSSRKGSKKSSKRGSKKGSKKGSMKRSSSKKSSKKGSKKGSRKQKRGLNPFMAKMFAIKKELKSKYSSLKDGPAMSKFVSMYIKDNNGDEQNALRDILKLGASDIEKKLEKINRDISDKRTAKKNSKQ